MYLITFKNKCVLNNICSVKLHIYISFTRVHFCYFFSMYIRHTLIQGTPSWKLVLTHIHSASCVCFENTCLMIQRCWNSF